MAVTPGQRLVQMLNESLPSGVVWDAGERVVLSLIEESADRAAVLAALLDAEVARPERTRIGCASRPRRSASCRPRLRR